MERRRTHSWAPETRAGDVRREGGGSSVLVTEKGPLLGEKNALFRRVERDGESALGSPRSTKIGRSFR